MRTHGPRAHRMRAAVRRIRRMHGSSQVSLTSTDGAVVRIGSRVRVQDDDGEEEFAVVRHEDADARADRVSADSPLGQALLGRRVGERIRFRAPGGVMAVTVVSVR